MFSKAINFLHFHRRRVAVTVGVVGAYGLTCYKAIKWENEILRFGIAGSLANVIIESAFHFMDTVNIRSKAAEKTISTSTIIQKIF
jgi:uncharacterized membrane protein